MPRACEPVYLSRLRTGELRERVRIAYHHLEDCDLCARYCHVNRRQTMTGAVCRTGERAVVHGFGPHHGEEDPLRGWRGSGTIFFSWCNLRCIYCRNWDISWKGMGHEVEPEDIAGMLQRQDRGCHNVNFVSPSHVVARLLATVQIAAAGGLACRWSIIQAATTVLKPCRVSAVLGSTNSASVTRCSLRGGQPVTLKSCGAHGGEQNVAISLSYATLLPLV